MPTMTLERPAQLPAEVDSADHADCGRLAANAILKQLYGRDIDCHAPDNATAYDIYDSLRALNLPGLTVDVSSGTPSMLLYDAIPKHQYLIVGVRCTGDCRPSPPGPFQARHWLAAYGQSGEVYNCWRSTYEVWNLDATHDPQMNFVRVWVTGASGGISPNDMSAEFAAQVISLFAFGRGINTDLYNQIVTDVRNSSDIAALYKWAGIAAKDGERNAAQRLADLAAFVGGAAAYGKPVSPHNLNDRVAALEQHTTTAPGEHTHQFSVSVTGSGSGTSGPAQ